MSATLTTLTTQQVANRLVELCRAGKIGEATEELYADNIESIEPLHSPVKSASGKKAVLAKGRELAMMIEERHGGAFSNAVVGGNFFSISMLLDATFKGAGRMTLDEICLYEVKDGKIIKEQFFF